MKYGAEEDDRIKPPSAGPVDWMVKQHGRYVLRIQRKTWDVAREDAMIALKTISSGSVIVMPANELLADSRTRSGVRKAIRRVSYVKMPKTKVKPNIEAAMGVLNKLMAQGGIPKHIRFALVKMSVLLVPRS